MQFLGFTYPLAPEHRIEFISANKIDCVLKPPAPKCGGRPKRMLHFKSEA